MNSNRNKSHDIAEQLKLAVQNYLVHTFSLHFNVVKRWRLQAAKMKDKMRG